MIKLVYIIVFSSLLWSNSLEEFLTSSNKSIEVDKISKIDSIEKFVPKEGEHKLNTMMREMKESIESIEYDVSTGIKKMVPIKKLKIKTQIKHDKVESQFIYPIFTDE